MNIAVLLCDTDTDSRSNNIIFDDDLHLGDRLTDPFRHRYRLFQRGEWQHDGKFFTAPACQYVTIAYDVFYR